MHDANPSISHGSCWWACRQQSRLLCPRGSPAALARCATSSSEQIYSTCSPATLQAACCALQVADKLLKLCQGNGGVYIKMGQFLASLQAIPQEIRQ